MFEGTQINNLPLLFLVVHQCEEEFYQLSVFTISTCIINFMHRLKDNSQGLMDVKLANGYAIARSVTFQVSKVRRNFRKKSIDELMHQNSQEHISMLLCSPMSEWCDEILAFINEVKFTDSLCNYFKSHNPVNISPI